MKGVAVADGLIQTEAFDLPAPEPRPDKAAAVRTAVVGPSAAGPGYARFDGTESPADIERMMREAFVPVRASLEGLARAVDPKHRWRDVRTGKFVPKRR